MIALFRMPSPFCRLFLSEICVQCISLNGGFYYSASCFLDILYLKFEHLSLKISTNCKLFFEFLFMLLPAKRRLIVVVFFRMWIPSLQGILMDVVLCPFSQGQNPSGSLPSCGSKGTPQAGSGIRGDPGVASVGKALKSAYV